MGSNKCSTCGGSKIVSCEWCGGEGCSSCDDLGFFVCDYCDDGEVACQDCYETSDPNGGDRVEAST